MFATSLVLSSLYLVGAKNIGDGLFKTYAHTRPLPMSESEASDDGWHKIGSCNNNLGQLYAQDRSGTSEDHPLGLYFTKAGQIAGVQTTVYGSNKDTGNAAQDSLVEQGFWKVKSQNESWTIDVSFRDPSIMCSGAVASETLGDRAVINQDTIKKALPLVKSEAISQSYTQGSCMADMGTHYFMDLKSAPKMSWEEDALMPVVAMYNPYTDNLHAFFFTTPVAQPGAKDLLFAKADWEAPALSVSNMCQNWCDESCTWSNTKYWSTMHIFLSSEWETLECPGGSGIIGRSCDL